MASSEPVPAFDAAVAPASSSSNLPPSNVGSGPEARLDHIIKGSPTANSKAAQVAMAYVQTPSIPHVTHTEASPPAAPKNPLDTHPTSPPTIYLNLIILEASLRSQYQKLQLRRRKYSVFLLLLCLWTGYFFNAVYVVGPSPYSIISTFEKLGLLGGIVTGLLFWMSGLYAKTMIWPRRLVGNANKGLRMFNVKLVVVNRSFSTRLRDWLEIIVKRHPLGWAYSVGLIKVPPPKHILGHNRKQSSIVVRPGTHTHTHSLRGSISGMPPGTPPPRSAADVALAQRALGSSRSPLPPAPDMFNPEDYLQSGESVKLVILAKHFSADFREGWEMYRTEYWEKENERRAIEVEAIKTSLDETGQLPPMNSHGVVIGAGAALPAGPAFPGISSRPARKPSVSSGSGVTTRQRAKSSVSSGPDPDATLRGTVPASPSPKGRPRVARKKSASSLRQESSFEDLGNEKASMDVKLKRRSLSRAPGTGSSTDTITSGEESGTGAL